MTGLLPRLLGAGQEGDHATAGVIILEKGETLACILLLLLLLLLAWEMQLWPVNPLTCMPVQDQRRCLVVEY